jgi:hypothetical protein
MTVKTVMAREEDVSFMCNVNYGTSTAFAAYKKFKSYHLNKLINNK